MFNQTINIILADDHLIVRGGVRGMLEKEKRFQVTGEANNGTEVLTLMANGAKADVVLVDMNMPVMGGLELTERLKKEYPATRVIIVSALDTEKYIIQAFRSGACGYLLKTVGPGELVFAVKHTHEFGTYICAELAKRFLNRLLTIPDPITNENVQGIEFSARDVEILTLLSEGFTNQEIADKLFTSKRTVENHRQQMIDRTESRNTIALIRFAMLNSII